VLPIVYALAAADPGGASLGAGLVLMGIGEVVRLWGASVLGRTARSARIRTAKLVTAGPYARTRHPLYWGNLALTAGFALASGAGRPWFPAAAAAGFLFLYGHHARREEAALAGAFPDAFARWRRAVPRWRWRLRPARVPGAGETGSPSWTRALRVEAWTIHAESWLLLLLWLRAHWG
jgi:protein-S-isoprenylcysteine O-methyltransferase Ste14